MQKDIRALCPSCKSKYLQAGYKLTLIWSTVKEPCDLCRVRMGWTFEVERRKR